MVRSKKQRHLAFKACAKLAAQRQRLKLQNFKEGVHRKGGTSHIKAPYRLASDFDFKERFWLK